MNGLPIAYCLLPINRRQGRSAHFNRQSAIGNRQFPSAFTLLELVVAMAMVAVVAVSLYASLRVAFRAKASAEAAIEPARSAEIVMEFVRQDLQNALPPGGVLAGAFVGTPGTDDRGRDAGDLVFYSTADAREHASANGEIKNIELTVTSNGSDHVLIRRARRNLLSPIVADPDEEILCRGVGAFGLRYFDGSDWQDSWDSSQENNALPAAVEVTLELERGAGTPDGPRTLKYVRVFSVPCSSVTESTVNLGEMLP